MDFSKFPERIISGIAHLTWVSILIFITIGKNLNEVLNHFKEISGGAAALYASVIIVLSFFFGNLFDNLIIIIVKLYMQFKKLKPKPISGLNKSVIKSNKGRVKELQNKYIDKAFFRSISFAGLWIIIFSTIWSIQYDAFNFQLF